MSTPLFFLGAQLRIICTRMECEAARGQTVKLGGGFIVFLLSISLRSYLCTPLLTAVQIGFDSLLFLLVYFSCSASIVYNNSFIANVS